MSFSLRFRVRSHQSVSRLSSALRLRSYLRGWETGSLMSLGFSFLFLYYILKTSIKLFILSQPSELIKPYPRRSWLWGEFGFIAVWEYSRRAREALEGVIEAESERVPCGTSTGFNHAGNLRPLVKRFKKTAESPRRVISNLEKRTFCNLACALRSENRHP